MKNTRNIILFMLVSFSAFADGGMYPINTISKIDLAKAGLKMNVNDIYNPNGQGLIKAVVQIGGCTGSFVSDKGLIVTNHHCAFGGLEPYSSPDNNLMEKGYIAMSQEKELSIKGLTCRILQSHQDVSAEVLKGTENITDGVKKKEIIAKNIQSFKQTENLKNPDLMLDVSEMLPGKSYMLFRYFLIKDLRIVYIPARNIGEFGGESDNWEWPRHTGDFSFVRAYVSPEGKGVDYNSVNVPYHPKEFLNINSKGLSENDFVFIVGYPGRTFKNQPSGFLRYQQENTHPFVSELFDWEINTIKSLGATDEKYMLRNEPKIKGLANTMKNYQGKLKTMRRIDLFNKRVEQEKEISGKLSKSSSALFKKNLFKNDSIYALVNKTAKTQMWYNNLFAECKMIDIARDINLFNKAYKSAKQEDKTKLKLSYIKLLRESYRNMYVRFDSLFMHKMMTDVYTKLPKLYFAHDTAGDYYGEYYLDGLGVKASNKTMNWVIQNWITNSYRKTKLMDSNYVFNLINQKPDKLSSLKDPFIVFINSRYPEYLKIDSMQVAYRAQLDAILPEYVDFRMEAMGQNFIPDANRTLRLTYGYIRGYSPSDATYCAPFTTVSGMQEKNGSASDYKMNADIARLVKLQDFGKYKLKDRDDLPLCMLYNLDTTGGNSGSPVLDSNGQLVAINFDRCVEATVNDYAWDESYSRSIGVDIRFVLWTTTHVAGGDYLLKEMSITQ